jgi:hypothetical protein
MFLRLLAKLGLDASGFEVGLKRSKSMAERFGRDLAGSMKGYMAAAFGAGAVAAMVKNAVDFGGRIADMSAKLDIATGTLQEYNYMAELTGGNLDTFAKAHQKLAQSQIDALDGNDKLVASFKRFGITLEDLKTKSAEELFRTVARSVETTETSSRQLDDLLSVLGKSAGELIPAMKEGFDIFIERARQLGIVLENDVIAKLDTLGDKFTEMELRARRPAAAVGAYAVDAFEFYEGHFGSARKAFDAARSPDVPWYKKVGRFFNAYQDALGDYNNKIANMVGAVPLPVPGKRKKKEEEKEEETKSPSDKSAAAGPPSPFDSLVKVGGFAHGGDAPLVSLQQRIAKATEETARNTSNSAGFF